MMRRNGSGLRRASALALAAAGLFGAGRAEAQGSVGAQGFGFPPGQLSTRATALGGAIAELDPVSPRNPSSVARWGRPGLYMQYDPEFRRVESVGGRDGTLNVRFPLIGGATRVHRRLSAGVSISTLLDRTYTNESSTVQQVEGADLTTTTLYQSAGGLNDVRLALAYDLLPRLSVGVAGHVVTGENRVTISTTFDRDGFLPVSQQSEVNYSGTAFSAGVNWIPGADLAVAGSMRLEGSLRASRDERTLDAGRLPSRAGLSLAYAGLPGAVFAVSANWEQWSRIELGSSNVRGQDTRDLGVGVEVEGPRVRSAIVALRAGFRSRGLPFGVTYVTPTDDIATRFVSEQALSIGAGIPLATYGGVSRAVLDLGLQRASRSGIDNISERAWTLSLGLAVRP